MIIPFAGIEMLALGGALYVCMNKLSRVETVTVSDEDITVCIRQRNEVQEICSFPKARMWATVSSAPSKMLKQKLWLCAHRSKIEIGAFLDDGEKHQLASVINRAITEH